MPDPSDGKYAALSLLKPTVAFLPPLYRPSQARLTRREFCGAYRLFVGAWSPPFSKRVGAVFAAPAFLQFC